MAQPSEHKKLLLLTITMMCMLNLIATDIYIPVMPIIQQYFHSSSHDIQMTLSAYLIGLSISQLFYGTISEKFGRK